MPSSMPLNVNQDRIQEGAGAGRREIDGCLENGVAYRWGPEMGWR